jgi:hypothetical protein
MLCSILGDVSPACAAVQEHLKPCCYHMLPSPEHRWLPLAGATLQIFDTIKSLNPAKGDFCINGSQSL